MNNIMPASSQAPAELRSRIVQYEEILKQFPQLDVPVTQYFSRGVYVRQVDIPAGTLLTGKIHKYPCISVVLTGACEVITEQGPTIVQAPAIFESPAGVKRAGRCIIDCRWITIHPYEGAELDEAAMCDLFHVDDFDQVTPNNDDYAALCEEFGTHDSVIRDVSELTHDYEPIPTFDLWEVKDSPINDKGVFALVPYPVGAVIGVARNEGKRTQLGKYVNHSAEPNAQHIFHGLDSVVQIAIRPIRPGDEITNNYRRSFMMHRELHGGTS